MFYSGRQNQSFLSVLLGDSLGRVSYPDSQTETSEMLAVKKGQKSGMMRGEGESILQRWHFSAYAYVSAEFRCVHFRIR